MQHSTHFSRDMRSKNRTSEGKIKLKTNISTFRKYNVAPERGQEAAQTCYQTKNGNEAMINMPLMPTLKQYSTS